MAKKGADQSVTTPVPADERGAVSIIKGWKENVRENWLAYLFLVPLFIYVVTLIWYPAVQGLYMTFFNWPIGGQPTYVGLKNYIFLLTWPIFWKTLQVTLLYATQIVGQMLFGVTMAFIIWQQDRFKGVLGAAFLLPYIMPHIVTGTVWRYLLNPLIGPVFQILVDLGILANPIYWLSNSTMAMTVVTLIASWTWTPVVFLFVIGGLESIPKEYYETARMYGANIWQRFRYVTYPQIKSTLMFALALRMIWNLTGVSQLLQITGGGPGYATTVLAALIYRLAWLQNLMGRAFAVGIVLGLVSFGVALFFLWQFERSGVEIEL